MEKGSVIMLQDNDGSMIDVLLEGTCWYRDEEYAVMTDQVTGEQLVTRVEHSEDGEFFGEPEGTEVTEIVLRLFRDVRGLTLVGEGKEDGSSYYSERGGWRLVAVVLRFALVWMVSLESASDALGAQSVNWFDSIWWMIAFGLSAYTVCLCVRVVLQTGGLREIFLGMTTAGMILLPKYVRLYPGLTAGCAVAFAVVMALLWQQRGWLPAFLEKHPKLKMYMQVQRDMESTRRNKPVSMRFIAMKRAASATAALLLLIPCGAEVTDMIREERENARLRAEYEAEQVGQTDLWEQSAATWATLDAEARFAWINELAAHDAAAQGMERVTFVYVDDIWMRPEIDCEARTVTHHLSGYGLREAIYAAVYYQRLIYQYDCVQQLEAGGAQIPDGPYFAVARAWSAEQKEWGIPGMAAGTVSNVDASDYAMERAEWYVNSMYMLAAEGE